MKCAVEDSSCITLKRPLARPGSLFFFLQHYKPHPGEASEICMLDCILDDKKGSLRLFGGLLLHCCALIQIQIVCKVELVID